jgi:hypothetical protein
MCCYVMSERVYNDIVHVQVKGPGWISITPSTPYYDAFHLERQIKIGRYLLD